MLTLHPLTAIGEVSPGDDLAGLLSGAIAVAGLAIEPGDILVVTQKIVSKAEGRYADLGSISPSEEARALARTTGKDARLVELVLAESSAVIRAAPNILITRHRSGHVMANAGIDRSNLGPGSGDHVLLLPLDADASAERLRATLPGSPPVVISDSFGRPWRMGVVNVAIGVAGLPAIDDRRGETDRDGRPLEVTQVAIGDLVASAAGLVAGEGAEGVPAVLMRGYVAPAAPPRPAAALVRPIGEDLFR